MRNLKSHQLKLAIVQPQIAPNTGNIGRLCVATGTELHLVRPLGFALSDHQLKRSGMDYWERLKLTLHDDLETFLRTIGSQRLWLFDSAGKADLWSATFADDDWLIFGNESHGLPDSLMDKLASRVLRIPQVANERCLNLATSAGIVLYEALRQLEIT